MFKIPVFYITILYVAVLNAKKCKEYILIISEDIFCPPVKLNEIDWHEFACPHNSTDILTYEEFFTNRSCVLEMTCNKGVNKYDSKYNSSRDKENICTPNEITTEATTIELTSSEITTTKTSTTDTTTTVKETAETTTTETANPDATTTETNTADTTATETLSVEKSNDTSPSECKADIHNNMCNKTNKTVRDDIINPNNEINLIFDNAVKTKSGYIEFDKRIDLTFIMSCDYTENICINANNNDIKENSTPSLKTIIVSLVKGNISKYDYEYKSLNKNLTYFNCTSFDNNTDVLNKQYLAFTYEIMKKFNCNNNTSYIHKVNLNLNIYAQSNVIFKKKNENFIKCAQTFILLDKETISMECETVEMPELNINSDKIHDTNQLTNSLIWNCDYKNPDYAIMCDKIQSQKYKLLHFQNCTGYHDSKNKHVNNSNFIINLNNTDKYAKNVRKIGPFSYNFQMHFLSNDSSCVDLNKQLYISKGRIFNLWTNDEESMIRKHYSSSSLININLLNCTINNPELKSINRNTTGILKLDIILNKQNSTNINIFKENDFNESEDIHTNKAIVNCMYPDLSNMILGNKPKLEVNCNLECIDYINETSNAINNKSSAEFESVEFPPIEEDFLQAIDKEKQYSGNIYKLPFESTTDFNIYHLKQLKTTAPKTDEIPENNKKKGTKAQNPQKNYKSTIESTTNFNVYSTLIKTTIPEPNEFPETKDKNIDKGPHNSENIDELTTDFSTNNPSKLFKTTRDVDDISEKHINKVTTEKSEITTTEYILNHSQYIFTETTKKYTDLTGTAATESSTQNKKIEIYTTEANKINGQSGYTGVKNETTVETAVTSPLLYLGAILGTICILSIIAIIGIKIWKPSHIYYGATKRDDNRDNEETKL